MTKMLHFLSIAFTVFFTLTTLTGCDPSISRSKDALERTLKDPGSVQYQDVTSYTEGVVCGKYNAKNEMGGYVGFKRFITLRGSLITGNEHANYMSLCNNDEKGKVELDEQKLGAFGFDVIDPTTRKEEYWVVTVHVVFERDKSGEVGKASDELGSIAKAVLARNIYGDSGWLASKSSLDNPVIESLKNELQKNSKKLAVKSASFTALPSMKFTK